MNKRGSSWTREEVMDLITIWDEIKNQWILQLSHHNRAVWEEVPKEMAA